MNVTLQPSAQGLGDRLHDAILKGNGAKVLGGTSRLKLGEEDQEGTVNAREVERPGVEVMEDRLNVCRDSGPEGDIEGGAEPVWAGA